MSDVRSVVDDHRAAPSGTTRRDYALADELDVSESHRLKALGDPLRMQICDLVLERAMSVTELASIVDRPKGTVAYHVDVLLDAGLLQVVRTRQVRAVEERYYGRAARTFIFPGTPGRLAFLDTVVAEIDHRRLDDAAAHHDRKDGSFGTVTYRHARIPPERVAEYSRRLHELALEFVDEPRAGDIEFGLYVALFPTNRLKDRPA
jgi:DNA-binding transcriptional ArsR family regulator